MKATVTAPESSRYDSRARLSDGPLLLACVALSLCVYLPALGSYFSSDDLILFERYRGLIAGVPTLWRFLSGRAYFDVAVPLFGVHPLPYLLVNWCLHGINAGLLYVCVRRLGGNAVAATVASAAFGASRLFFTVVAQVVGIGELMSLAFVLVALLLIASPRRRDQALAGVAFLAALLSKETVILLPLVLLTLPAIGPTLRVRMRRVAPLLLVGGAWASYLAITGTRSNIFGGPAYESALGANLIGSLASYAQWSVDLTSLAPDTAGTVSRLPSWFGVGVLLVITVLALLMARRSRLPVAGLLWWSLGVVPVLPLLHQHYLHYLYASVAGLAMAIGGLASVPLTTRRPVVMRAATIGVAGLALIAYSGQSARLIHERIRQVLPNADIPADPFVRKVELIRRVSARTRENIGDRHARIVICIPRVAGTTDFFMRLLPEVLDGGRGLRALYPNIDSVRFRERWRPEDRDFELVAGSMDGFLLFFGTGPEAHLRFARTLEANGYDAEARAHLAASIVAYPGDSQLLAAYRQSNDADSARVTSQ